MLNFPSRLGYPITSINLAQRVKSQETKLPVKNEGCRSQFLLHEAPTSKVCLFFHGFTAAPYQFLPMGRVLYQAGYNVLIPRMPGHGQAGDWNRDNPPPLPTNPNTYKQFGLEWLQKAQTLGDRVIVGGLSGGGTLAAWLAFERAQEIDRALLFAPYLSSSNKVIDLFVKTFNTYFEWIDDTPQYQVIGYKGFMVEALRVYLDMGKEILQKSKNAASAPMFIVSTEADKAVSITDHQVLFENILKRQPKSWYYEFDRILNIPLTMLTKAEGKKWENLLNVIAKAYVQSELTWAEVEEIAYRMTDGKTFNQVVAELKVADRASPDMPAFITMVDKRAIVLKRNPGMNPDLL
ncbi:MAG: alpha/beta fold hydrolase [Phormidesmis sp. CAN_BIN44]|nr:alpha/beta fold hydrolase [Phormidesmis sp. CAN_BIN44]